MDGVVSRKRSEYNDRLHLAHTTALFSGVKGLPELSEFTIDVDERPSKKPLPTKEDLDTNLKQWAILLGNKEQRELLCL